MREIKFRYVYALDEDGGYEFWIYKLWEIQDGANNIEEIPFAINQYTGLKDKNDKEIYEGDVVRWSDGDYEAPGNPRIAEVRFAPELCFYAFNVGGGHKFGFSNFIYTDTEKHLEVIGNIYENPELASPPKDN